MVSDRTIVNDVRAGSPSQSRYHALAQQPHRKNTETHIVNQAKISAVTLARTKRRGALDKCQSSIKAYSRSQELPRTNWYMMLSQVGSTKSRVFLSFLSFLLFLPDRSLLKCRRVRILLRFSCYPRASIRNRRRNREGNRSFEYRPGQGILQTLDESWKSWKLPDSSEQTACVTGIRTIM